MQLWYVLDGNKTRSAWQPGNYSAKGKKHTFVVTGQLFVSSLSHIMLVCAALKSKGEEIPSFCFILFEPT